MVPDSRRFTLSVTRGCLAALAPREGEGAGGEGVGADEAGGAQAGEGGEV